MIRKLMTLVVGLLLVGSSAGADAKKVILRWHGQSMFTLVFSQGTVVVFDPHAIEAYGRISIPKADAICVSHFHTDHNQLDVVQDYKRAKVLVGLKGTPSKMDWVPIDEKVKDIRIRSVGTYHDDSLGMERGKNTVFVIEVDGLRIVHLGDLGHQLSRDQLEKIGSVDVLMIPVGGIYTLNGADAKKVVKQLKPKMYIVPMHFGTKVFDEVLTVDEFLEDQKKDTIDRRDGRQLSNELAIRTDFRPKEPTIVVLNYK